jgi:hypothetical protein
VPEKRHYARLDSGAEATLIRESTATSLNDRNGKFKRGNGKRSSSSSSSGGGAGDKAVGDDDETPAASSSRKSALSASNKRVRMERKEDESS